MQVYSKQIIQFIHEIKLQVKSIIAKEIGLEVGSSRFYDKMRRISYPIKIVIFNNKPMLGYFNSEFYELGFHETLMRSSKEQLHNIIKHELAHYMTFINHGSHVAHHGLEFRSFCISMGWERDIYAATTCLDDQVINVDLSPSSVLRRVQKLMALSSSQNANESELAMLKARELLLKHHLDENAIDNELEEKIFLKRILKQKRENAKMRSIALILETFLVNIVYSKSREGTYLEIVGTSLNIEIAEYVADFLEIELDKLWELARKREMLKGAIQKNSFYLGIAKGFCDKIQFLKKEYEKEAFNGLMLIEKKLVEMKEMVYPTLRKSTSRGCYSHEAGLAGQRAGKSLNINMGVGRAKQSGAFLS